MELNVVPAFSVKRDAGAGDRARRRGARRHGQAGRARDLRVGHQRHEGRRTGVGRAHRAGRLEGDAGRARRSRSRRKTKSLSARFLVTAPAPAKAGDYALKAVVTSPATGAEQFSSGYQEIEYPHVQRRQVIKPAETSVKVIDVKIAPNLKVGYIMRRRRSGAAGDRAARREAHVHRHATSWRGATCRSTTSSSPACARTSGATICAPTTAACSTTPNAGGTVHRPLQQDRVQPGAVRPVSGADRRLRASAAASTTRRSPVKMLVPTHPVFNFPNKIGPSAWDNWAQERGQYFLGQKDPKYVDLVSMTDSFPDNPGEQARRARRSEVRQGPLDLPRPRALAPAARGHVGRVSAAGESAQPAEGAGPARGEVGPRAASPTILTSGRTVRRFSLPTHTMRIGVPKEIHEGERRVATTPEVAAQLQKLGFTVAIEAGAGERAAFNDDAYRAAGATVVTDTARAVGVERHHPQSPRARAPSRPRRQTKSICSTRARR